MDDRDMTLPHVSCDSGIIRFASDPRASGSFLLIEGGRTIQVFVPLCATLGELRGALRLHPGLPIGQLRRGRGGAPMLSDERSLASHGLTTGATVSIFQGLAGGGLFRSLHIHAREFQDQLVDSSNGCCYS